MKRYIIALLMGSALPMWSQTYSLEQCQQMAKTHNIALRTADANIAMAKEQRREAFTHYFPTVSASGMAMNANKNMLEIGLMGMNIGMLKNGVAGAVTAVQPVFAGGQIVHGNKLAKTAEEASLLQRHLSENEVVLKTEEYYWQIVSLEEKQKTLQALREMLESLHKDVALAVKAGLINRNDLLQVQLKQNEVESNDLKLRNGVSLARMALAQYIGADNDQFALSDRASVEAMPAFDLNLHQDHATAVSQTTEYQLLEKNVRAKELQRKIEVGKRLPTVGVGAGYIYNDLLEKGRSFGLVFAQVSIPISDWWGGSHAIKRQRIAVDLAKEELKDNAELLVLRMQKDWNDVEEAYKQLQLARKGIEQAEENLRLNNDYYRAGTSKMSDLLEAQTHFQQTHDQYCDAYVAYRTKLTAYRQACGQRSE